MRVSELRIGNLVNGIYADNYGHLKIDEKETICKVTTLDISDLSDYPIYVESDEGIEHFDEFEGIPLTEEWLLKFGFDFYQNIGARKFMNFGNLIIETNAHKDIPVYYTEQRELICIIKYVHQLQNLYFALTGEELTIKQQEQ
jgi:hypothetical protein